MGTGREHYAGTVLGFLVQCEICPQRAMVAAQPSEDGWVCPRCTEVTGPSPDPASEADDEYPIGKVRG
ncbi:hypothetical protein [Mycolicibacterium fluoranthenivorans]|uniref:Uncharacterized protein n=1 Tax=Mycolicibacterium fluoranthenivorans TaxID=258505 RepID=A0A7X5U4C2_9MYCO|nr:hypothetical protein [Mycolicibacterium fluoranthenivorans]MCV7358510.1 hypothetical protein [Mycolicibacterium fluoranthenivorans]NIH98087.1 hypothetical protein [Mycolicibacterium fluoranthenivorans]